MRSLHVTRANGCSTRFRCCSGMARFPGSRKWPCICKDNWAPRLPIGKVSSPLTNTSGPPMVNLGYQMTALEEFHRSATVLSNVRAHERAMLIEMTLPKPTQLPRSARFLAEEILWPFPPPDWSSAISATHIWAIPLDLNPAAVEEFHATLASAERERAARFQFPRARHRFVVGRGALRHILGRYLQTA